MKLKRKIELYLITPLNFSYLNEYSIRFKLYDKVHQMCTLQIMFYEIVLFE